MVLFHLFSLVLLYNLLNTEARVTTKLNSNDILTENLQRTVEDVYQLKSNSILKDLNEEENGEMNRKLHEIELSRISNNKNRDTSQSYGDEYEHLSPCSSEEISELNIDGKSGAKTFDFSGEEFVKLKDVCSEEISDEIAMRIGSPQNLLGHFVAGKKIIQSAINKGIRGTMAFLAGFNELTDDIERFLSKL